MAKRAINKPSKDFIIVSLALPIASGLPADKIHLTPPIITMTMARATIAEEPKVYKALIYLPMVEPEISICPVSELKGCSRRSFMGPVASGAVGAGVVPVVPVPGAGVVVVVAGLQQYFVPDLFNAHQLFSSAPTSVSPVAQAVLQVFGEAQVVVVVPGRQQTLSVGLVQADESTRLPGVSGVMQEPLQVPPLPQLKAKAGVLMKNNK